MWHLKGQNSVISTSLERRISALFNNAVTCWDWQLCGELAAWHWQLVWCTGSTILTADEPYWRHDTNSGRPKNSDRYLPPCHFVLRHKSLKMPVQSVQNVSICGITFTVICEMALWWLLWPKLVAVDITYILLCYTEYVYIYIYCYLTYVNLLISLLNNLPFRSSSPCLFTVQLCAVQLWAVQRVLCSVCCTTVCCTIVCCTVCAVPPNVMSEPIPLQWRGKIGRKWKKLERYFTKRNLHF